MQSNSCPRRRRGQLPPRWLRRARRKIRFFRDEGGDISFLSRSCSHFWRLAIPRRKDAGRPAQAGTSRPFNQGEGGGARCDGLIGVGLSYALSVQVESQLRLIV